MKINETRNALTLMSGTEEVSLQENLAWAPLIHPEDPLEHGIKLRSGREYPSLSFPGHPQSSTGRINGAPLSSEDEAFLQEIVDTWLCCTHHGNILSRVDLINDVPRYLAELGVGHLIPYLLITEKTGAFVFNADLGKKNVVRIVEIYQGRRATEWRVPHAQFALRLDDDLEAGLIDDVAVVDFVVPFAKTALAEVGRGRFELPRAID